MSDPQATTNHEERTTRSSRTHRRQSDRIFRGSKNCINAGILLFLTANLVIMVPYVYMTYLTSTNEISALENQLHGPPMKETAIVENSINLTTDKNSGNEKKDLHVSKQTSATSAEDEMDETAAFQRLLKRAEMSNTTCNSLPSAAYHHEKGHETATTKWGRNTTSGVNFLPEFGIVHALRDWFALSDDEKRMAKEKGGEDEELCRLPPRTSCHASKLSAVFMSHATDRLGKLIGGLNGFASWSVVGEIILVWNSDRSVLETDGNGKKLLGWHDDDSHPLRIFFSLENGLPNCLLNRYHPLIKPKYEALMYFDDDGPFFSELAMADVGFELWRRNSDVQIGSFQRNIRFTSERMKKKQEEATELSIQMVLNGRDGENREEGEIPQFTPVCRDTEGQKLEYNYFEFPQYVAHYILPSGSFLHRNYLCFMFHPALQELRKYVLEHPTKPDDMTMSTLVSHLIGKAPRAFPRRVDEAKKKEKTADQQQNRRKLLWSDNKEIWAEIREEASNSVTGYFGSASPGSVGWCVGTEYQKRKVRKGQVIYSCDPEFPTIDLVPWVNEGGLGYDQCDPPHIGGNGV